MGFAMWLCLNSAFLSIVEPEQDSEVLRVRARRKGDIEKVFPEAKVERTPERDYLFRAHIRRERVAEAVAEQVAGINYGNFKNSVKNDKLHSAYGSIWSIMARLQSSPPYSGVRARRQPGMF